MPTRATPAKSTQRKKTKTTPARPRKELPAALARRATAAASAKHARLRAEAHAHLALISRRKKEITEAFYDIGEALAQLKRRDMIEALGRRTFAEVCEKDAGISAATGQRLVEVATSMTREQALAMGQKKALAMVAPRDATANELERAATAARHARADASGGGRHRGRTTTAEERQLAELLQRRLRKLGLDRAVVTAVATKPGQGADLRFEHIPAARVDVLKKGIGT